jgi:hypothetical protein
MLDPIQYDFLFLFTSYQFADPHPQAFGLLNPHPESAFQMRMRIRDKLRKKLKFLNILCVYYKGTVQREFSSVF